MFSHILDITSKCPLYLSSIVNGRVPCLKTCSAHTALLELPLNPPTVMNEDTFNCELMTSRLIRLLFSPNELCLVVLTSGCGCSDKVRSLMVVFKSVSEPMCGFALQSGVCF